MTTKLLEAGGKYELGADIGRFELPEPANENYAPAVQSQLANFNERLLSTTALSPVDAKLREYNSEAMGILNLSSLSSEEQITFKLARFFQGTRRAVDLVLRDKGANDNSPSLLQTA